MVITIPDTLTFIIPFIVTLLSSFLRDSKLPAYANALIALGSILITAVACVWLSGSWSGNPQILAIAVLLYVGYLARNDFKTIIDYLLGLQSPLAPEPDSHATYPLPDNTLL